MGSESTGVTAKALGRNFAGIESDEALSEVTTIDVVDMKTNKLF